VDDDDITLLGAFYNPAAPPLAPPGQSEASLTAVPEPSTLALLVLAFCPVIGWLCRRRR
jgi:hypothetical protein